MATNENNDITPLKLEDRTIFKCPGGVRQTAEENSYESNNEDGGQRLASVQNDAEETASGGRLYKVKLECQSNFESNTADPTSGHLNLKTVTKKKSFACDTCDKVFGNKSHLTEHRRLHSGERPYTCDICQRTFVQSGGLSQHKKRMHFKESSDTVTEENTRQVCVGELPSEAVLHHDDLELGESVNSLKDKANQEDSPADQTSSTESFQLKIRTNEDEIPSELSLNLLATRNSKKRKSSRPMKLQNAAFNEDISALNMQGDELNGVELLDKIHSQFYGEEASSDDRITSSEQDCEEKQTENKVEIRSLFSKHHLPKRKSRRTTHSVSVENCVEKPSAAEQKPNGKSFSCEVCGKLFRSQGHLRDHVRTHTGERPYKCDICSKSFVQSSHLSQHRKIHFNDRPHECEFCQFRFFSTSTLKKHIRRRHTKKDTPPGASITDEASEVVDAGRLGQTLALSQTLALRKGTQALEAALKSRDLVGDDREHSLGMDQGLDQGLDTSGEALPNLYQNREVKTDSTADENIDKFIKEQLSGEALLHSEMCSDEALSKGVKRIRKRQYVQCELCDKWFTRRETYVWHMRRHNGIKPYACDLCDLRFVRKGDLTDHRKRHTSDKLWECDICKKRFKDRGQLNYHRKYHLGSDLRPHACQYCGKGFVRRSKLKIHLRTHTKEQPFACEVCSRRFSCQSSLGRHLKQIHNMSKTAEVFKCELCDAICLATGQPHAYSCPVCSKIYHRKGALVCEKEDTNEQDSQSYDEMDHVEEKSLVDVSAV